MVQLSPRNSSRARLTTAHRDGLGRSVGPSTPFWPLPTLAEEPLDLRCTRAAPSIDSLQEVLPYPPSIKPATLRETPDASSAADRMPPTGVSGYPQAVLRPDVLTPHQRPRGGRTHIHLAGLWRFAEAFQEMASTCG